VPQRIDTGPAIAALGAVVLFLSLFLSWYEPDVTGWEAFESLDVILAALAIAAGVLATGRLGGPIGADAGAWVLPVLGLGGLVAVAVQLIQAPPAVADTDPSTGAWLALAASALIFVGGALQAARVSVTVTVASRDGRRRVPAVDRRHAGEPAEHAEPEPAAAQEPPAASGADPDRTETYNVRDLLGDERREPAGERADDEETTS
jgi:hypothetical protein